MSNILDVDKNFKPQTKINKSDIKFYDIKKKPFSLHGIEYADGKYRRMPEQIAKNISDGVAFFHANTAGGRVRFKTDSPYLAIKVKYANCDEFKYFNFLGAIYFDVYAKEDGKEEFLRSFSAPLNNIIENFEDYEQVVDFDSGELRDITINFPPYCEICELFVGLSENAVVLEAEPYKYEKPIVYYGSSITQGACCSRPGNAYPCVISRRFDADFINLGFSGSARAEEKMADYIKDLPMSVFVYDYDFNAPDEEYLKNTHEKMYKIIRNANPFLPIIILGRPKFDYPKLRFDIIKETYENARSRGEKVYLLNGEELMALAQKDGTLDNCHPNDFGFASMAKAIGDIIEDILMGE